MSNIKDIDELPQSRQRNDKYIQRDEEIITCLKIEVGKGKEISTSNPGAWKTAFYKKWKELKDYQSELEKEGSESKVSVIIDYKSIEYTIQTTNSSIKIWRTK